PVLPGIVFGSRLADAGLPERVAGAIQVGIERALDSGRVEALEFDLAVGGASRHLEARSAPSGVDATVATGRAITARKRAEADRERLEQQLRQSQKMEAIGTLAGGIAHDFNNILTAIIGHTELLRAKRAGDADLQERLAEIGKAGARAKQLVAQILTFSRRQ